MNNLTSTQPQPRIYPQQQQQQQHQPYYYQQPHQPQPYQQQSYQQQPYQYQYQQHQHQHQFQQQAYQQPPQLNPLLISINQAIQNSTSQPQPHQQQTSFPAYYPPQPAPNQHQFSNTSTVHAFPLVHQPPIQPYYSQNYPLQVHYNHQNPASAYAHHPAQPRNPTLNHSHHREKFPCEQCNQIFYNLTDLSHHLRNHVRCDYEECRFEAIQAVLDIHKEDRHLIFKPGREPKPKKLDGPPNATIQGLGYALKTQEQIDQWIQERKKNWPTQKRIAQKLEERRNQPSEPPRAAQKRPGKTRPAAEERGGEWKKRKLSAEPAAAERAEASTRGAGEVTKAAGADGPVRAETSPGQAAGDGSRPAGQDPADAGDSSSSDSEDMDPVKDAVSSKLQPAAPDPVHTPLPAPPRPASNRICKWFRMGRCRNKDRCLYAHPAPSQSDAGLNPRTKAPTRAARQPQPVFAFDRSGLFSKLVEKDVAQDVADVHAVLAFLCANQFLDGVQLAVSPDRAPVQELS